MAKVAINYNHGTNFDDAKTGVRELMENFHKKYAALIKDLSWSPDGTSANFSGSAFTGLFKLAQTTISVDINLSLFATPFAGKVKTEMEEALKKRFPNGSIV